MSDYNIDEANIPAEAFDDNKEAPKCPISGAEIGETPHAYFFEGVDLKLDSKVNFPKDLRGKEFTPEDWIEWVQAWHDDEDLPVWNFKVKATGKEYSSSLLLVPCEKYGWKFDLPPKVGEIADLDIDGDKVEIFEDHYKAACVSDVYLSREIAKRQMSISEYKEFIENPDSKTLLSGFKSTSGKTFSAYLIWGTIDKGKNKGNRKIDLGFPER